MTDNKLKNFELYFVVELVKSDTREYRQDSDQLLPDNILKVCILLPRENEYVYNLSEISKKELSGETAPDPVLTPKGFAYIKMELEKGFEVPKIKPSEEDWAETEKNLEPGKVEDWVRTDPVKQKAAELEDWGNTADPFKAEKVTEEKWDDKEEKW